MANKLSSYSASNITTLRRILPFGIILVVIAAGLATQVTAYYYRYPSEFGLPILTLGSVKLYQPLQFFIWALNYSDQKGISYGWGAFGMSIFISFGGFFFLWFRSIIKERTSDSAYGSAAWGDPTDPKYGLNQKNGLVLGKDKNNRYLIDNRDTHAIIAAATGSGKTAGPAILTLLSYEGSMVVTDVKGELFALTSGSRSKFSDIHNFNPLSADPKTKINPLLLVRPGLDAIEDCTVMASAILPREVKQARNIGYPKRENG